MKVSLVILAITVITWPHFSNADAKKPCLVKMDEVARQFRGAVNYIDESEERPTAKLKKLREYLEKHSKELDQYVNETLSTPLPEPVLKSILAADVAVTVNPDRSTLPFGWDFVYRFYHDPLGVLKISLERREHLDGQRRLMHTRDAEFKFDGEKFIGYYNGNGVARFIIKQDDLTKLYVTWYGDHKEINSVVNLPQPAPPAGQ